MKRLEDLLRMEKLQLINAKRSCMVVIDPQERLMKAVEKPEKVVKNINLLMKTAEVFDIPVIATTQYKKGLGPIVSEIELSAKRLFQIDKTEFNCFFNKDFISILNNLPPAIDTLILSGVEAHICVFQTAVAAMERNFSTWVASDAVSSRSKKNKKQALTLMTQNTIFCAPTETIVYQVLKKAGTEQFKSLLSHLK